MANETPIRMVPSKADFIMWSARMRKNVNTVLRAGMIGIANEMVEDLKELTPDSGVAGIHMSDGWTLRPMTSAELKASAGPDVVKTKSGVLRGSTDFGLLIYNSDPRFTDEIKLKGGRESTTLGEILEYGSRPHKIKAKRGGVLRFFWEKIGKDVQFKSVNHPGTQAYAMIGIASSDAAEKGERLLSALARVIHDTRIKRTT